ncbi:MAG: CbiX/SirB N-terminal domain-containing protein [Verrucomicrobiota bacterium]|nr:CbiX/SirB N-terminal domain-containing protein [Verrucomicrobiota bacterium]
MDEQNCILLVDNGSYRAASVLSLRRIAKDLSERVGCKVHPVSLLHSTKIDPDELNGVRADIVEPFITGKLATGIERFLVVPLFFGRSAAIYEYLPQRVEEIKKDFPNLEVRIADPLVDMGSSASDDVAQILADLVRLKISEEKLKTPSVTLVDHGTPRKEVNDVRNFIANQLKRILSDEVSAVAPSSMESRSGPEYDFNKPLLEDLLGSDGFCSDVVLSMLFVSPGRHAGDGGDIHTICIESEKKNNGLKTYMSGLFSEHEGTVKILESRLRKGMESMPI